MIDLLQTAAALGTLLDSKGWKYCFIGGLAVQQWGEPRLTRDVDVTILTGFGGEETYIRELLSHFTSRIERADEFALANRVLLLRTSDGIDLDISLGGLPFEESVVRRAKKIEMLPGTTFRICSPEDLIVLKAFASRAIDWHDVEGVIIRQGKANLNWGYITSNLQPLAELKGSLEIMQKLEALRTSA